MQKVVLNAFSFLLFFLFSFGTVAQTVEEEQAKLAKLKRQNENMASLTEDLQGRLSELAGEITEAKSAAAPKNDGLSKAATALQNAQVAHAADPSATNKDKLEMAEFKHALALRKQQKSNPALTELLEEQNELQRAIKSNEQKTANNITLIGSQEKLIASMKVEAERARESWLRRQEQQKADAQRIAQEKAEQERIAALAEVERLRKLLAEQQNSQEQQQRQALAAEASAEAKIVETEPRSAAPAALEGFTYLRTAEEIKAEKDRVFKRRTQSVSKSTSFNKFVSIKTYQNGALVDRSTVRLKSKGGQIFQSGSVETTVTDLEFVIGRDSWRVDLSAVDTSLPKNSVVDLIITLDRADKKAPKLIIYPR